MESMGPCAGRVHAGEAVRKQILVKEVGTMIRLFARNIQHSTGTAKQGGAGKIRPTMAAKQFPAADASANRIEALKRKEARLKRQIIRDVNNLKQHSIVNAAFKSDPVLGMEHTPFVEQMKQEAREADNLAHGYERAEFEKIVYGAQKAALNKPVAGGEFIHEELVRKEEKKRAALLTILNMKNSNGADARKRAIAFARREFQREEGDTGSPEVQAAVMTAKIHFGYQHMQNMPKDKHHIQTMRELVQQRQKMLKFLKKDNAERYYYTIAKLGLTDDVVTSEFSMSKQYFQDYKVWGDKQLVKLSDKEKKKEQKFADLRKKVNEYNKLAKANAMAAGASVQQD